MRSIRRGLLLAILAALAVPTRAAEPDKSSAPAKANPTQAELEQQFAEMLSGATLAGHFSVDGQAGEPSEDRYAISKVTKVAGETWKFEVRIMYGQHDVTLPLLLTVKWAGDTPVITLTDMAVPGLGTYTARVLFYRGQYAGTWSGGDHGGEIWGRVEKPAAAGADGKPNDAKAKPSADGSDKKPD